jgi:hypothetical protein
VRARARLPFAALADKLFGVSNTSTARATRLSYAAAVAVILSAAILVRSWGALIAPLDFWADEAWWATLLETRSLGDLGFRPVGYMWLCRQLMDLGPPEVMLRLPSWLAGIGAVALMLWGASLSYRSRAAVLVVLLLAAFHPKLIVFAKEFKPFSVEVFVFAGLTAWALACLRRGRATPGLVAAALAALPFCYPVVFLYPALLLAFAGEKLAALRRLSTLQLIVAASALAALLLFAHMRLFEVLDAAQSRAFWGSKYGVFPLDQGFVGTAAWYARRTWDLLALPGALDALPSSLRGWFALASLGGLVALIAEKRLRELALLLTPLAAVALANALGYWPYGAFRANLFLIPAGLLIGGHAVDWLAGRARLRVASWALVAVVMLAVLAVDPRVHASKSIAHWAPSPQLTAVLDDIERRRLAGAGRWNDVILADWHSWRPIAYYLRDFPALGAGTRLVRGPIADYPALEAMLDNELKAERNEALPTRLWLVVTRLDPHGAIRSSRAVSELGVYRREFPGRDPGYHPVLIELRSPRAN